MPLRAAAGQAVQGFAFAAVLRTLPLPSFTRKVALGIFIEIKMSKKWDVFRRTERNAIICLMWVIFANQKIVFVIKMYEDRFLKNVLITYARMNKIIR